MRDAAFSALAAIAKVFFLDVSCCYLPTRLLLLCNFCCNISCAFCLVGWYEAFREVTGET